MDYYANASADNIRLARSKMILEPVDGTHNIIRIPRYAMLMEVFFNLITPYSGTSTGAVTVGFCGNGVTADVDGVLVDSYISSEAAGMSRMTGGSAALSEGYWFKDASGAITLTVSVGDSSNAIACEAFAFYSVIH